MDALKYKLGESFRLRILYLKPKNPRNVLLTRKDMKMADNEPQFALSGELFCLILKF